MVRNDPSASFLSSMSKKLKKPAIRSIFFNVPLYGFDVLIIVGAKNKMDVMEQMKKQRVGAKIAEEFLSDSKLDFLLKQEAGSLSPDDDLRIIYLFRDWEYTSYFLKVLVHEVSHMVDDIAKHKNLTKETEAKAYLSEYLFDTIRRELCR